jgi:hypothetical protein
MLNAVSYILLQVHQCLVVHVKIFGHSNFQFGTFAATRTVFQNPLRPLLVEILIYLQPQSLLLLALTTITMELQDQLPTVNYHLILARFCFVSAGAIECVSRNARILQ